MITNSSTAVAIAHDITGNHPYKVSVAALVGTIMEYYDYGIYGYLSATLGPLFFPSHDPVVSIASTLLVFGVAFVFRPLGGAVLGTLGDRTGRKKVLVFTVLTMGVATSLIGCLPTHQTIGVVAPVLLVGCRILQGFSAGGEASGAATYIAECAPAGRRGFFGTATPVGAGLGFVVSAGIAALTSAVLSAEQLSGWGWRLPFLLALPLAGACVAVRSGIEDSPEFERMAKSSTVVKSPLREALRTEPVGILRVCALTIAMTAGAYIGLTYLNVYLTKTLGYPSRHVLWLIAGATLAAVILQPVAGHMSDRVGRRPLLLVGLAGYLVLPYPALLLMNRGSFGLVALGTLILFGPFTLIQAIGYPTFAEMISSRVRYTGLSIGFNIGTIIGGGLSPYLAVSLVDSTGDRLAPAYLVIVAALIGALGLLRAPETASVPLRAGTIQAER